MQICLLSYHNIKSPLIFYLARFNFVSFNFILLIFLISSHLFLPHVILTGIQLLRTIPYHTVQMKMLCVHKAQYQDVQFVVAVRAFPAVNNILSLWVFLGLLETKS